MTTATYTLAGDGDVDDLCDLRYEWRAVERFDSGLDRLAFREEWRRWFDAHRSSHVPFVARVGTDAVGCAWLVIIDRVPSPANLRRRAGMVQSVYVRASHRSTGIGDALLRTLIESARARELEYLLVHPSTASFAFYRRLGFEKADRALELRFTL